MNKRNDKYVGLSNLNIYYTRKIINLAITWNEEFEWPDKSHSVSDIQGIRIRTWYYLELLTPESVKLLGKIKEKITKNKNGENVPHLEITVVLIHCHIANNNIQQDSRVLYRFLSIKSFDELLDKILNH